MNDYYADFQFPKLEPDLWNNVFNKKHYPKVSSESIDLISRILVYFPFGRIQAIEALGHPFFDELKKKNVNLPNGKKLPNLFNFKKKEFDYGGKECRKIIPKEKILIFCKEFFCFWDKGFSIC
jgi:serine/threonine protein kinase